MLSLQGYPLPVPRLLPGVLQSLNLLYSFSVTHRELTRPAFHNFSNSFLDVTPAELTIQCFIHPTGSLTVNRLKMVILLSGNTTWHRCRPQTHTHTHTGTKTCTKRGCDFWVKKCGRRKKGRDDCDKKKEQCRLIVAIWTDEQTWEVITPTLLHKLWLNWMTGGDGAWMTYSMKLNKLAHGNIYFNYLSLGREMEE